MLSVFLSKANLTKIVNRNIGTLNLTYSLHYFIHFICVCQYLKILVVGGVIPFVTVEHFSGRFP